VLGGGDVFRREVDGEVFRFSLIGLWGSGNAVTERELLPTGTNNAYTMWDGHALFGPPDRADLSMEKYPALIADLPRQEFLDRYGFLGDDCLVWTGEEELGVDCEPTCAHVADVCDDAYDAQSCLEQCAGWPRAISECMATATTCPDETTCNLPQWEDLQTR